MERVRKMTYEDFEMYLEDTKKAIEQLEENWIQAGIKLNAFLSMRKDNTKAVSISGLIVIWIVNVKTKRMIFYR